MHARCTRPPAGYTLLQLLAAMGIIALLMALAIKSYMIARSAAMANACASKMKLLAMDLERYHTEYRRYPALLQQLYPDYAKGADAFHCPEDNRPGALTYADFYVLRSQGEKDGGRLLLSCPFHRDAGKGVEVFFSGAGDSERDKTCVAKLTDGGGRVSVLSYEAERPDNQEPTSDAFWAKAITAVPNMDVGPGDWLRVPAGGTATLLFKDNSQAQITGPAETMVVDAFRRSLENSKSVYYTVLRLARGTIYNIVTPGSKYEVVTPTGTAGAKGTEYLVYYDPDPLGGPELPPIKGKGKGRNKPKGHAAVDVTKGTVYVTGAYGSIQVNPGEVADVSETGVPKKHKKP